MYSVDCNVGRLVEIRMASPLTAAEVQDIFHRVRLAVLGSTQRVVICGELRKMTVLQPEWAEMFTQMFTRDNPKVERSALLVGQRIGSLGMQVERMVREAGNPARRVFDDPLVATGYLDPVLSPSERARVRELFGLPANAVGTPPA